MSIKQAQSFKRGQLWEAGFDGLYNTDDAIDAITAKVGQACDDDAPRGIESKTQDIHREREREAYERAVLSRAEHFKDAFSRMDLDGDGRLSFDEFSQGLHSLGVILPQQEVKAIWGQVGTLKTCCRSIVHPRLGRAVSACFSQSLPAPANQIHPSPSRLCGVVRSPAACL